MSPYFKTYKSPISIILALVIAAGIFAYSRIQTSLFPEITFPKIKIIADNGEQPVDKMMITVTRPLEEAIKQVPDLQVVRSSTSRGSCEISAFFKWKSDIDLDQQMLESRINEIRNELPPSTQINVEKMNPSILQVMGYILESHTKNPTELRMIADYTVKPFLSQIDGLASVQIMGGKVKEYWVELNQAKMSSIGITPATIATALNQTNFINSNGYLSDYRRMYLTLTDEGLYHKEDIENVVIKNSGKRVVLLKDLAKIEIREKIEYTKINANGKDAILIGILKQPNANLVSLTDKVKEKITELNNLLPKGVTIEPYYVQADFVNDSLRSVSDSLWIGLLLAIVVAMLFLHSFRASSTILITIPVTIGLTIVVLAVLGYTLNIMTFGAIAAAIGLIIDDAIVVVEQIHRSQEEHPGEKSDFVVRKAISFLFPSMVGSSLSTIVIFFPFLLMSGVAGAYFKVLTNTMIITLVCSFFVTWLGLPVIYLLMPAKSLFARKKALVSAEPAKTVTKQRWVSFFIHRPAITFLFISFLISSIIYIIPKLETGFLPEMDEGSIVLDYLTPPGTSLEASNDMLLEVDKIVNQIPEVECFSRRTGAQLGFFITEPNNGDYLIQLKKDRKRTTEEVIEDIRSRIESTQPALQIDFGQVVGDMLGDLMASVQPIEIKIFGNDRTKLEELAKQVSTLVEKVDGTADVFDGITIAGPSAEIKPDNAKLAQFGITPDDFQYQMQTHLEGNMAGSVMEKEQLTNIRMIYNEERSSDLASMKRLRVFMPDGKLVPVTGLASVNLKKGVAEIQRENLHTIAVVTARLSSRDLGSVMKDIQQKVNTGVSLPQGYHIVYAGAFAEQQKSFSELLLILLSASLLVFTVILFLFRDIRISLLILFIAVLGVSGSYLALFITGTPLNVGSYTGLIMIIGIIGENAIFTFQQFQTTLQNSTVDEAIVYAISTRLRPKLMTAIGAIIALMPLALGIGTGSQMHQPLAIAVIGGFIIALPLLLVVLPTLLRLTFKNSERNKP